jgi:hypothetical protein
MRYETLSSKSSWPVTNPYSNGEATLFLICIKGRHYLREGASRDHGAMTPRI